MQRALGRAYQRFQGGHPRRPPSKGTPLAELVCDALLLLAIATFLAGVAVVVAGLIGGVHVARLLVGGALVLAGPVLLLVWERLAWEPFVKRLSHLD